MELKIRLSEKDLFSFNMYHSYHRAQTWLFTVLGVVICILSFTTYGKVDLMYTLLYFFAGLIFIFYTPLNLRTSAKIVMRSGGAVSQPMRYRFDEKGIEVSFDAGATGQESTEDAATSISWNQVFKVVETKKAFLIYTSPKNASILPLEQCKEQAKALREIFKKELESYQYDH